MPGAAALARWCSPTTGVTCHSRSCVPPAASPATAPRRATSSRAARLYGLEAKGQRLELPRLADLRLPAIAFWNFNHFVVVEGFGPKGVDLNDPASGPRRVGWEEFDRSFTGVMLVFEPGPEFAKAGSPPSVLRGLASRLRGATAGLVLCLVAGLALVIPGLALAAFLKIFVDQVLVAHTTSWVLPVAIGLALAAIAAGILTWLQQATLLRLSTKLSLSMSTRFPGRTPCGCRCRSSPSATRDTSSLA